MDKEIEAIQRMFTLMKDFDYPTKRRIVRYLSVRVLDDDEHNSYDENYELSGKGKDDPCTPMAT